MRVVAGDLGGRTIKSVPGMNTRPTLDKVKESVFNALGQFFDGGNALDLYAGSGNLGIEAISRGVEHCIFVDKDYKAFQTIKENIDTLKINTQSKIYKMDAFKALNFFCEEKVKFDYVFLDPPYQKQRINEVIENLVDNKLLNNDAVIVCECLKEDKLLEQYQTVYFIKEYIYGMTKITIFQNRGVGNE